VAVDVKHISATLLGARGDEQVRNGDTMLAACGKLALSPERDRERLGVHPQVAELLEVIHRQLVVAGGNHFCWRTWPIRPAQNERGPAGLEALSHCLAGQ
jgi:hypothetical protein